MSDSYKYNLGLYFEYISEKYSSDNAIITESDNYNYAYLSKLSNKFAHYILKCNIKKNDTVAILNDKSLEAYAIMIACLKIGVIYTNLDPESPVERFCKMIETCNPQVLFHFDSNSETIVGIKNRTTLLLIDYTELCFKNELSVYDDSLPIQTKSVHSDTCAYIMFTSGSTGFPKGVAISHQNVINFIQWSKVTYKTKGDDIFTNINPMHFDNSVFDFYSSLFAGASLISVSQSLSKNPRKLIDYLNLKKPTIWFSVPSMLVFTLNLRAIRESDLLSLRVVTFGGEGFPKNQLRKLWGLWGTRVRFVNVYGPTECTCICSSYEVSSADMDTDDLLPLGYMAPNFYGLVINSEGKQVGYNEIGELYIGGPNVGMGYFNSKDKTKEVFISNPLNSAFHEVVYKSGDLVKLDSKTNMFVFSGRKDNQIKRMGYRIELEEIENAFNSIESISECAVLFIDNEKYASKIIACLNTKERDEVNLVKILKNYLPSYMLPDLFFYYETLPKNQNGKIDRLKLKEELNK